MNRIKQVLMKRDKISESEADILIDDVKETFEQYIAENDIEGAYNVLYDIGLEPDYLDDLIWRKYNYMLKRIIEFISEFHLNMQISWAEYMDYYETMKQRRKYKKKKKNI